MVKEWKNKRALLAKYGRWERRMRKVLGLLVVFFVNLVAFMAIEIEGDRHDEGRLVFERPVAMGVKAEPIYTPSEIRMMSYLIREDVDAVVDSWYNTEWRTWWAERELATLVRRQGSMTQGEFLERYVETLDVAIDALNPSPRRRRVPDHIRRELAVVKVALAQK